MNGPGTIGRILIIEDEANILEALSFILGRAGWDVRGHGKGDGALDAVDRVGPDLVILDMMLPGCSGLEVLRDLRTKADATQLPVMMLTARGQPKDREDAMAVGANAFLSKPFSNDELLEMVAKLLPAGQKVVQPPSGA